MAARLQRTVVNGAAGLPENNKKLREQLSPKTLTVLIFYVFANGSHLAYVEKRGYIPLNFTSLHLCDLALDPRNEKDAMTQGRKDWKPQNPSESEKSLYSADPFMKEYPQKSN